VGETPLILYSKKDDNSRSKNKHNNIPCNVYCRINIINRMVNIQMKKTIENKCVQVGKSYCKDCDGYDNKCIGYIPKKDVKYLNKRK
jgi:hypothetical protein